MTILGTETAMKRTNKMKYQLLILLVCWLWNATISKADPCSNFQGEVEHHNLLTVCGFEDYGHISVVCEDNNGRLWCNVSITDTIFCEESYPTSSDSSDLTIALGVLVGLLLLLLVVVTTGCVWTWWCSVRERRRNIRSNNIIESQINPCYNQPTLAIYKSIPSHPKQDNKREGGKQGEDSYDILNREQLGAVMDQETIRAEAKMFYYSKLELADKIKPEKNPAYATTTAQSDV